MEFNTEIATFQGAIISADNVHQFSSINSKGGNEEKVKFVIDSIKRFLEMERYIDEQGLVESRESSMRKFAMYLVLNSDLPVLHEMVDLEALEPLIWSIPTVSKYLFCEMMWQLHFEKFIYEMIPACWPQLGLELAEAIILNFKYLNPTECVNSLYKLSAASYALLCRLAYFSYQDDDALRSTMEPAFKNLENCLKFYTEPPNQHRLDALSTDDLYKYKGQLFKTLLYLVYDCFNLYNQNINTKNDDPIYKATYHTDYLHDINCKVYESPNTMVVECLNNSNNILLDVFQKVVMSVSVNMFCAWSEYEEEGKSFQQAIGELCHNVQLKLEAVSAVSEHPVVSMIQMMARKPTEIKDVINTTETDEILTKINNNDEHSPSWIQALVHYENLHNNFELIRAVNTHINTYDSTASYKLYKMLEKATSDKQEDQTLLVNMKVRLMAKCNATDKHRILKSQFKDNILCNNIRQGDNFDSKLNEMFNKYNSAPNADLSPVLTVFYLNPRQVFTKIFTLAAHNNELIGTMLKVMLLLKDYTKCYYVNDTEPCTVQVMKYVLANSCENVVHSNNIIQFICKLKENDIISGSHLLILVIMPSIHTALVSENIKRLRNLLQLLIDAYTMVELTDYRAPMLVMVAQIMDIVRFQNLNRFQMDAIQTLDKAIQFQKSVINTYRDVIPDTDGSWLRSKLRDLNLLPLNLYYFKSLWNVEQKLLLLSVTGKTLQEEIGLNELSLHLAKVLPFGTLEEWCTLFSDLQTSGMRDTEAICVLYATVAAIIEAALSYRSNKTRAGIMYCITNFIHILRYEFIKEPLTDGCVKKCATYLARMLEKTHPDDTAEVETVIRPFLCYLSARRYEYNVDVVHYFREHRYHEVVKRYFPEEIVTEPSDT